MTGHRSKLILVMVVASALLMLDSCSSPGNKPIATGPAGVASGGGPSTSGAPPQFYTPPGAVLDVKYTSNTIRLDFPTVQKTLGGASPDGQILVFDASDSRLRDLAPGKVIFLEHLGVRRVVDVHTEGSQIGVFTDPAYLGDFIQDGRIEFHAPINFGGGQAQVLSPLGGSDLLADLQGWLSGPTPLYAMETNPGAIALHAKGKINDWEFDLSGQPKAGGLSLSLQAAKKLAGLTASVTATGDVGHLNTGFRAIIQGTKVQDMDYSTPLQGKVHVAWAVLTDGQNPGIGEARLKLPPFAKDVIDIYGLPFLFQVDEALIFKPGFGGKKDAGSGGFDIVYNGTGGLSIHGPQASPQGTMQEQPSLQKTTTESLAPHGVVLAVDAPKVSISLGTDSFEEAIKEAIPDAVANMPLVQKFKQMFFSHTMSQRPPTNDFFKLNGAAYVQLVSEFDFTGSGPLSIVPCSMTHFNLYAQAGADAQLLALQASSPSVNIFKSSQAIRDPDIPACGNK